NNPVYPKQRPRTKRSFELPSVSSDEDSDGFANEEVEEFDGNSDEELSENSSEEMSDVYEESSDDNEDILLKRRLKDEISEEDSGSDIEAESFEKKPRLKAVSTKKPKSDESEVLALRLPVIDSSGRIKRIPGDLEVDIENAKAITEQNKALKAAKLAKRMDKTKKDGKKVEIKIAEIRSQQESEQRKAEIDAILEAKRPTNPAELRVFLQEQLASVAAAIMETP
ncbi:hypothetical protein HK096_001647, partial [Nowakowskiella sp. JEL0078]